MVGNPDVGFGTAEYCLSIGGGSIVTAEPSDRIFDMAQNGELCCHWTSELGLSVSGWDLVSPHFHLLIGATSVNEQCFLTAEVCQKAFSSGVLTSMGTRAAGWKTTGRAANLAIGFHGATVGVVGSQTWDLVKIGDVVTSSDGLGFYTKSMRIFARILNLMADSNHLTVRKSYR